MDKKNFKKVEQTKTDKKDQGDNSKKSDKVVRKSLEIPANVKVSHLDRGDSELKLLDKPKVNETKIAKNKVTENRKDEKSDPKLVNKGERRRQINRPLHAVDNAKYTDLDSESKLHKTDKKDRGDNSKKSDKVVRKSLEIPANVKVSHLDRGDSELKLLDKPKVNETKIAKNVVTENRKDEKSDPKLVNKGERRRQINRPLHAVDNAKYTDLDSESKLHKPEKNKAILKPEGSKKVIKNSKENLPKNIEKSDSDVVNRTERVERRKIKEKHPLQSKTVLGTALVSGKEEIKLNAKTPSIDVKNDRLIKKPNELKDLTEKNNPLIESGKSEQVKEINRDLTHRRPIIKTVTAKINDNTKVFKAVTFVEQRNKPAPLQIKIPNEVKNIKNSKAVETNTDIKKDNTTVSKDSVRERGNQKKAEKRKNEGIRQVRSPDIAMRGSSPQTEVAKWAPSSINRHTKPYYEAWVSTTLAAISKNSKKDKLFLEKQNILQTFQSALADRPETPELVYENFKDERYAGRIKVKQR